MFFYVTQLPLVEVNTTTAAAAAAAAAANSAAVYFSAAIWGLAFMQDMTLFEVLQ